MKDSMSTHGLKEPRFEERERFFKVTFHGPSDEILNLVKSKDIVNLRDLKINERQIEALKLMVNEKVKMTIREYKEKFWISEKTAKRDIKKLVDLGLVVKRGVKKGAFFEAS